MKNRIKYEKIICATGRDKSAIVRVTLKKKKVTENPKKGRIRARNKFLTSDKSGLINKIIEPLLLTGTINTFDIYLNTQGGGYKSQAEASSLAISNGLAKYSTEFKNILTNHRLLRRDVRRVQPKNTGQPKARRKRQYSKR